MTVSFLDRIVTAKREEVRRLTTARRELEERAAAAPAPRDMKAALRRVDRRGTGSPPEASDPAPLRVLAEVKFLSPSKGPLRPRGDPARIAQRYEECGAAAVSVLCDGPFFGGGWVDLELVRATVGIPVLAKEFVLDDVQVVAARASGADAVLLIVRIVTDAELAALARSILAHGMTPVVEVASRADLERAAAITPAIVGVNCRDLETFQLDPRAFEELLPALPAAAVGIAMSGVTGRADLARLRSTRADAVLVGEHLMRAPDPGQALADLLEPAPGRVDGP